MSIKMRMIAVLAVLMLALTVFTGCEKEAEAPAPVDAAELSGKITVWSFTDEVGGHDRALQCQIPQH